MSTWRTVALLLITACSAGAQNPSTSGSQSTPPQQQQQKVPRVYEQVEVTATRLPEEPEQVPAAIEVFSGDELQARGARDLRSALALAVGLDVAPGGDAGPAGFVPEFWGLKEFDAFLLVVDGVPWGGAFNPALTTLDLHDIERIEVLRGPAPVMYGATSFVGVIQVIHRDTADRTRELTLRGGTFASGGGSLSLPIPLPGNWSSRLTVNAEREGFRDERTAYRRGHGLWRVMHKGNGENSNRVWFNADLNWLNQDPASPRVRDGAELSPLTPVDSNYNPAGAFLNDHRFTFMGGFDRAALGGRWATTASISHSRQQQFRGFLLELADAPDNAHGVRENIQLTDFYLDSHLSWKLRSDVVFLLGADYLHGTGRAQGADFDYTVPLSGEAVDVAEPSDLDVHINDNRDFVGVYGSLEWRPVERVRIDGGLRLNVTHERLEHIDPAETPSTALDSRTETRASGSLGAAFTAWEHNQDSLNLYVTYRDQFKPAAIDFGIESEGLLEPETSRSVEGGFKGRFFQRRVEAEASVFLMDFSNLVTPTSIGGVPALINAGKERFKGFESGIALFVARNITARATYSFHDARFRDFMQDFGGGPVQLAGNRIEMSARHLASFGINYAPVRGFLGGVEFNYVGSRYLNKRNSALADGFPTIGLSAGYRTPRWELRVDARNLEDRRDPVAESELGDAQYYLLHPRRADVTFLLHF